MSCLRCPIVVAAGQLALSAAVLEAEPALRVLCAEHFRGFVNDRLKESIRVTREASRAWCACGREIYLDRVPMICSRCMLDSIGHPCRSAPVPAGHVPIKIDADWYSKPKCDAVPCDLAPFRLPDGRTVCEEHGAPRKAEKTQDLAGRS